MSATLNGFTKQIFAEVLIAKSCRIIDDVRWSAENRRFEGSFLWHGIPTSLRALSAFASFVAESTVRANFPDVIAGVSSSGIAWATSVALHICRPLGVLRLTPHRYGYQNADLKRYRGKTAWLIDNFAGSGDTLREADTTLREIGIDPTHTVTVESIRTTKVIGALETEAKLRDLLGYEYFSSLGREVVSRYLADQHGWLEDEEWVRSVKRRITQQVVGGSTEGS